MTQICVIPQEVAVSDFELTQKCAIPQEIAVSDFELTQKCVMENLRLQVGEGGLDTKLCHRESETATRGR